MKLKRLFSLSLVLLLLLGIFPVTALAAEPVTQGSCGDTATWNLDQNGVLTISGTGDMDIGTGSAPWYPVKDQVLSVVVEDGITAICDYAFMNMFYATSISIGKDVTTIGEYAFSGWNAITSVTIPDNVESIGYEAFSLCENLTEAVIGNGVTFIDYYAFLDCASLARVTLGSNYKTFDTSVFENCTKLKDVTIDNDSYVSDGGVVYSKDKTALVFIPTGITGKFTIPATVTHIQAGALDYCYGLDSLTIPPSVNKIDKQSYGEMGRVSTVYFKGGTTQWEAIEKTDCADFFANIIKFYNGPVIAKQPASVKAGNGKAAKVTVQATGDGLKYQWYYKNKGESAFKKSSNTTNTYSATMSATTNGRQVYCVITDEYGNKVTTKTVTMSLSFCITKQPVSVTVIKNKTAKISVSAEGEGLTYQWYYKTKSDKSFKKLSSAKSSSYSVKMTSSKNGRQMYCVIKDKYGNTLKTSTVTLKVAPKVKITKQPATVKVNAGKTASTTVKASGDGLKYTWYYKNKGSSSYSKSSITSATYTTTMSASVNGRKVYCVVTDKYGQTVKSKTVTLYAKTTITKQPASVKVANGKTASVSVSAAGQSLSYKWYYKNPGAKSFKKASTKKSTYSCTMSPSVNGRQVYCVVKSKYGGSIKSNVVTLTMGPTIKLAITKQPVNQSAFEGETVKLSVAAQGEGLTYAWYFKNKGASSFTKSSCTSSTYPTTIKPVSDGRQVYCVVKDKYGNKLQTNTVTMTLKEPEVDLTDGYWGYLGMYSEYEYDLFAFAFSDDGVGYVGVTYWQMFVEGTIPDASVPYFEIGGYRFYMQDFGSEREFTYSRSDNTVTITCSDGGVLVAEIQDAETMVITSFENFVCGEALTVGGQLFWVAAEDDPS